MINLVLAGQLFGTAFACGLNLYATVALLGIAVRYDLIAGVPAGMGGLGNGLIIAGAVFLYLIGWIADRIPVVGTTWEAVHTLIRPAAAGGLAVLALQGLPPLIVVGATLTAAAISLAAHGSKAGLRLIIAARHRPRPVLRALISLGEDVLALAIIAAALLFPEAAIFVVAASAALLLLAGPRLWRAAFLALRAILARARGFFGQRGWRSREQMPRSLRSAVPVEPLGCGPARAAPAAVAGLGGVGAYRSGWLVLTWDGPRFVYRTMFRSRSARLPAVSHVRVDVGLVADALYVSTDSADTPRPFTIFLLKDGPPSHVAAAELSSNGSK
jgi:hypothetical protein